MALKKHRNFKRRLLYRFLTPEEFQNLGEHQRYVVALDKEREFYADQEWEKHTVQLLPQHEPEWPGTYDPAEIRHMLMNYGVTGRPLTLCMEYAMGYTMKELAELYGISDDTVGREIAKAREIIGNGL